MANKIKKFRAALIVVTMLAALAAGAWLIVSWAGGSNRSAPRASAIPGDWIKMPAGSFLMGCSTAELCLEGGEKQRKVTLTRGFEMQATEVTQEQFTKLMGYNPSSFKHCGSRCPVETMSWYEAAAYCNALSLGHGLDSCYACTGKGQDIRCEDAPTYKGARIQACPGYRLPTEAEWEYAYRAGTTTQLHGGKITFCDKKPDPTADRISWYECNSAVKYEGCYIGPELACGTPCKGPHEVGQKEPNRWGLLDMSGNVWEWCHDRYAVDLGEAPVVDPWGPEAGTERTLRGGAWDSTPTRIRATARDMGHPSRARDFCKGFRCVRTR